MPIDITITNLGATHYRGVLQALDLSIVGASGSNVFIGKDCPPVDESTVSGSPTSAKYIWPGAGRIGIAFDLPPGASRTLLTHADLRCVATFTSPGQVEVVGSFQTIRAGTQDDSNFVVTPQATVTIVQ